MLARGGDLNIFSFPSKLSFCPYQDVFVEKLNASAACHGLSWALGLIGAEQGPSVVLECTSPMDLTEDCMHREEYMQMALSWLVTLSPLAITTQAAYSGIT